MWAGTRWDCRWSGRARGEAGWCWPPTPPISTPISSAAFRIRSFSTPATFWKVTAAPISWPIPPSTSFPAMILWFWKNIPPPATNSKAGSPGWISHGKNRMADVGPAGRDDVVHPSGLHRPPDPRGPFPHHLVRYGLERRRLRRSLDLLFHRLHDRQSAVGIPAGLRGFARGDAGRGGDLDRRQRGPRMGGRLCGLRPRTDRARSGRGRGLSRRISRRRRVPPRRQPVARHGPLLQRSLAGQSHHAPACDPHGPRFRMAIRLLDYRRHGRGLAGLVVDDCAASLAHPPTPAKRARILLAESIQPPRRPGDVHVWPRRIRAGRGLVYEPAIFESRRGFYASRFGPHPLDSVGGISVRILLLGLDRRPLYQGRHRPRHARLSAPYGLGPSAGCDAVGGPMGRAGVVFLGHVYRRRFHHDGASHGRAPVPPPASGPGGWAGKRLLVRGISRWDPGLWTMD